MNEGMRSQQPSTLFSDGRWELAPQFVTGDHDSRHVLHITQDGDGEWRAWCCCGWSSDTWRLQESARTAAETHVAFINSRRSL